MPAGTRIRGNNAFGITTDNPLTIGATTLNSGQLGTLPAVSGNHAVLTLDPLRQFGEPEIVVVTAHGAGATSATITRGAYSTSARAHPVGTTWVHAPINEDVISILTSGTRPADPYRGEMIFETDTNRYVGRSTSDAWQQVGLFFDPPACRVFHNANQSIADNTTTTLAFNSERFDTDNMHDTVMSNSRITFNTAGIYLVTLNVQLEVTNDITLFNSVIRLNGSTLIAGQLVGTNTQVNENMYQTVSTVYKFAATDFVEARVRHDNVTNTARNIFAVGNFSPEFSAIWIGRGN